MQPYAMERIDGHEAFYPEGAAGWKVRLVGLGLGEMRVKLVARDRSGSVSMRCQRRYWSSQAMARLCAAESHDPIISSMTTARLCADRA